MVGKNTARKGNIGALDIAPGKAETGLILGKQRSERLDKAFAEYPRHFLIQAEYLIGLVTLVAAKQFVATVARQ